MKVHTGHVITLLEEDDDADADEDDEENGRMTGGELI